MTRSGIAAATAMIFFSASAWALNESFLKDAPVPAQAYVGQFLATFKKYPQRQKAASFNLDEVMEKLKENHGSK